ncbi:MAG TPA: FAD-dependent oxidoreductase [Acidimicrobiales bacterium]
MIRCAGAAGSGVEGRVDPVDVVVVGAGIAGASAAWALAREGAKVALLEREPHPGLHATGRSAALTNETVGHPVVASLARASRGFLDGPPAGFAEHPLLSPRGLLWIGDDPAALDRVTATARDGVARRIDPGEVRDLVPAISPGRAAAGGVHEHGARSVDVAALLDGYLRGLRHADGVIHQAAPVDAARAVPGGWEIQAGPTVLSCRDLVNAAGAWGDEVADRAGVRPLGLTPLRRTACIVRAGADVRAWPLIMDAVGGAYAEPDAGGLLVSPADETPSPACDARPDEVDVARAVDWLCETCTLPTRSVRHAWAGLRTFAPDRLPVAGRDPEVNGFYWLVGQGGAGIKTAPALAALVAADLAGGRAAVPGGEGLPDGVVRAVRPDRLR